MRMGSELYHHLKALIKKKYGLDATAVGDEGGFAPNFQNNGEALELLVEAIKKAGYEGKIMIGMDIAASEFFKNGKYDLDFKNPETKERDRGHQGPQHGEGPGLGYDGVPQVWGDRGLLHRRPGGGSRNRADQDWGALQVRETRQVQPAPQD